MLSVQGLTAFVLLALSVRAQQPTFLGALRLQPGLDGTKCLTAASNVDGASVAIQACTEADAQKWTFTGGSIQVFGNKCLDVTGGNKANGNQLQIWTCTGDANQQFSYGVYDNRVTWTNNNKCLDLSAGNTASGTPAQMWDCFSNINQVWNLGYSANNLPQISQKDQSGTNNCGTSSDPSAKCQTLWVNSAQDFCLWGPSQPNSTIGDVERDVVAYCSKAGRGARTFPDGTLTGVHFVKTSEYVQVTGVGDFTKINIRKNDAGGELDNRGADARGNPIGGLVYGNTFGQDYQYHDWTTFISDSQFCIRACIGRDATSLCQHIYDEMGCEWNMPANYSPGVFENCDGDTDLPMGVYGTSTWHQGQSPTPTAHSPASSSNCQTLPTVTTSPLQRRHNGLLKRHIAQPTQPTGAPAPPSSQ